MEKDESFKYKHIYIYWRSVALITGDDRKTKYLQLFTLLKYIISLSHRNTVPERRFSVNKRLVNSHGSTVYEDTLEAHYSDKSGLYKIDLLLLK